MNASAASDTHGRLPVVLAVGTADATREALLALLEATAGQPELLLDASGIEAVDAAGIQTLLALKAELAAGGRSLRLLAASPALESALGLCSLGREFVCTATPA